MYSDLLLLSRRVCVSICVCVCVCVCVCFLVLYHVSLDGLAMLIFHSTPSLQGMLAALFWGKKKNEKKKNQKTEEDK